MSRDAFVFFAHGVQAGGGGDFGHVDVKLCFHQQRIGATIDEAAGLFKITLVQFVIADVAQRDGLGARADGAGDETLAAIVKAIGCSTGNLHGGHVHFIGAVGQAKLRQHHFVGAERIGLHAIGAGGKIAGVDFFNHVRAGEHQKIGTQFSLPQKSFSISRLKVKICGAHAAIKNHDAVVQK